MDFGNYFLKNKETFTDLEVVESYGHNVNDLATIGFRQVPGEGSIVECVICKLKACLITNTILHDEEVEAKIRDRNYIDWKEQNYHFCQYVINGKVDFNLYKLEERINSFNGIQIHEEYTIPYLALTGFYKYDSVFGEDSIICVNCGLCLHCDNMIKNVNMLTMHTDIYSLIKCTFINSLDDRLFYRYPEYAAEDVFLNSSKLNRLSDLSIPITTQKQIIKLIFTSPDFPGENGEDKLTLENFSCALKMLRESDSIKYKSYKYKEICKVCNKEQAEYINYPCGHKTRCRQCMILGSIFDIECDECDRYIKKFSCYVD